MKLEKKIKQQIYTLTISGTIVFIIWIIYLVIGFKEIVKLMK